jgi:hypothetical protein
VLKSGAARQNDTQGSSVGADPRNKSFPRSPDAEPDAKPTYPFNMQVVALIWSPGIFFVSGSVAAMANLP